MRDVLVMWRSSKMVVLVALSAAIYAAILIPFKIIPIVPGFTELRPGNAIPIVCGLLFGPAAAWGCAIGNLMADFFGTVGPGSFFGLIGNFLFAYVPYRLWVMFKGFNPPRGTWREVPLLVLVIFLGSAACAVIIGTGLDLLGLVPYVVLTSIITVNNSVAGIVLGIPLLILMYPRAHKWNLTYSQIMHEDDIKTTPITPIAGLVLMAACIVGVFAALDKTGALASWGSKLGMLTLEPALDADGKPIPVSLLMPAEMSLRELGMWCSLLIVLGSSLMARIGSRHSRTTAAGVSDEKPTGVGDGVIAVSDLHFAYGDSIIPALHEVSFRQKSGQMRLLMGRTGAGKSTLCLCMNGVIPHMQSGDFAGTVHIGGQDTRSQSVDDLSQVAGLVFQDFETQLFCSDVELEVAFGLENRGVPREAMRERVNHWLDTLGLGHLLGRDPITLSGGEKQRLALAAVMAAEPPIVVLDEPTTDLDPLGRAQVIDAVESLATQGRTILLATDDPTHGTGTDPLLVLSEGAVAYDGACGHLLRDVARARAVGLRPHPLAEIAQAVGLPDVPETAAEAVRTLRDCAAVLDEPALTRRRDSEREPFAGGEAVAVDLVSHSYGGPASLQRVSLQVRQGEFVAILGPNGSGKTTLCKLMMGLLTPHQGTVRVNGRDVAAMSVTDLASQIGYLYQNPDSQIFADTVFDEVAFGPRNLGRSREEVTRLVADAIEVTELVGLESADPFALTRGQRQRVALAAILACEPGIIVFDEPTTGLDVPQQEAMMELLHQLQTQGHTIIVVTHHTEMAMRYASRLILLREGQVVADDTVRDVVADERALQAACQRIPAVVEISMALFGVPLLSPEEFGEYVRLS